MKVVRDKYKSFSDFFSYIFIDTIPRKLTILFICFCILSLTNNFLSAAYADTVTYSIHFGSYKNIENAEKEVTRLKRLGYDAFHRCETIKGKGKWYRAYIGTYGSRTMAKREARALKEAGLISYSSTRALGQLPGEQKEVGELTKEHRVLNAGVKGEEGTKYSTKSIEEEEVQSASITEEEYKGREEHLEIKNDLSKRESVVQDQADREETSVDNLSISVTGKKDGIEDIGRSEKKTAKVKKDSAGPFSVSIQIGYLFSSKMKGFRINKTDASTNETWLIDNDDALKVALIPSYRFNRYFSLDGGIERVVAQGISSDSLKICPKLTWDLSDGIYPYSKVGAVYGNFHWDHAPGKFDNSLGWEASFGILFLRSKLKFGIDCSYSSIEFDYKAPSGQGVSSNYNSIDLSGYSISGSLVYYF